ncbi:MAG: hypothetical protein DWB44_15815 [Chloroflexi bacterium]|nr:hypothetical protein [Chloroflexota bacterium]
MLQDRKVGQQFNYADKKGIPLVVLQGPDEAARSEVKVKRLRDGVEVTVAAAVLAETVRSMLV